MVMKKLKRILAGVLAGVLIGTCSIPGTVRAEVGDTQSAVQEEKTNTENKVEEKAEGIETDEQTVSPEENNVPVEQEFVEESESEGEVSESLLNYLYVESPHLETPAEENLVVSWGDGTEAVEKMEIIYLHNEQESSFELENKGEGLYLYQKEFTEEESGVYELTNLKITEAGQEFTYDLAEVGIQACFGVNEYYPGYEPEVTEETAGSDEGVAVVTEEDVESSEAEAIVGDTLAAVGAEANGVAQISAYALNDNARTSNGQIVVALDAGHCDKHAGASGNGVREEVATLKIAQYCKEELEKYAGIKVYMCRTSAACPYPDVDAIADIKKRVQASATQGADIYVSIHLNSSPATTAYGAEVWYPDGSQTPNTVGPGKELAQKIQSELVSIGLGNRGAQDTKDNFACMAEGGKYNLPAIIVEHAFLSNVGDANKYLKTEAGLKSLGVADATGIARYFGLSKSRWETDDAGNKYYYEGGEKVFGGKKIDGYWYYFDTITGKMYTGWRTSTSGKTYYYDEEGHMSVRGKKIEGQWYYFNEYNGVMHTGWRTSDSGYTYYYNREGQMSFGEKEIDGQRYFFNKSNGIMYTGWRTSADGEIYHYKKNGQMSLGGNKIDGYWYYFEENSGMMHTGWRTSDSGYRYYYDEEGRMSFRGKKVEGQWYYFNENNGIMYTGWRTSDSGYRYYYDEEGRMSFRGKKVEGQWYYFNENNGIMYTGWRTSDSGNKYYYDEEGKMSFRGKKVESQWYYFNENNGVMHTGWRTSDSGYTYYYDENGCMVFGWKEIDGKIYHFNESNGILLPKEVLTKIEGQSKVTIEQMVKFYENYSPIDFPAQALEEGGVSTLKQFAEIYYEESKKEGIKPEIAWAQSMLETGWLRFGGQVEIKQLNFAGLGALDGGEKGADFSIYGKEGVRMGVRAQIQHLKAYSSSTISETTLKETCVDPRFRFVNPKGCAPYVEYLGQNENPNHKGWATSIGYGYKIMELVEKLEQI